VFGSVYVRFRKYRRDETLRSDIKKTKKNSRFSKYYRTAVAKTKWPRRPIPRRSAIHDFRYPFYDLPTRDGGHEIVVVLNTFGTHRISAFSVTWARRTYYTLSPGHGVTANTNENLRTDVSLFLPRNTQRARFQYRNVYN